MKTRLFFFFLFISFSSTLHSEGRTPEAIYKTVVDSVVILNVINMDGTGCIGSGFILNDSTSIISCFHVVRNAKKIVVKFSNNEEYEVQGVLAKDEKRDLVALKINSREKKFLKIQPTLPNIGERVFVIGAPRGLEFSISDGIVSQVRLTNGVKFIQFSCPASPGNSGGPLVNQNGDLIGVVSWQVIDGQNLNFAIPAKHVLEMELQKECTPFSVVKGNAESVNPKNSNDDSVLVDDLINLVNTKAKEKKFDEALEDLNGYLIKYPDNPRLLVEKAFVLNDLKRSREAIDCVELALKIMPDNPKFYLSASQIYLSTKFFGKMEQAIRKCQELLNFKNFDPAEVVGVLRRLSESKGRLQLEIDKKKEEIKALEKDVNLNSNRKKTKEFQKKAAELDDFFKKSQNELFILQDSEMKKVIPKLDSLFEKCEAFEKEKK